MKIVIKETSSGAAQYIAQAITSFVQEVEGPVIGFATGNTQLPVYSALARSYRAGAVSYRDLRSFNLDEYVGLDQQSRYSYASYMKQNFFSQTDIRPENVHLINGNAPSAQAEAERYEISIGERGGIGLQVLSLGRNGHIGFNEPGTSFASRTHVQKLSSETIEANRDQLPAAVPEFAITLGLATILEAHQILLLATGCAKASAVRSLVQGPITVSCPASALWMHDKTTVVLDGEAAAYL